MYICKCIWAKKGGGGGGGGGGGVFFSFSIQLFLLL
jgi:hypothetical protein